MHETDEIYCFCHLSCKYNNYCIIKREKGYKNIAM